MLSTLRDDTSTDGDLVTTSDGQLYVANHIWNTTSLAWEKATGSLAGGSSVEVSNFPATYAVTNTNFADIKTELQVINSLVPDAYDYIAFTYVAAGNGAGEIETIVFKTGGSGGTTVSTLTFAYDANDEISSITQS